MTDMIDWLRSPKPWHKYTPAEVADEIERLREINYELQFGMGLRDKHIAKQRAVVDAAHQYVEQMSGETWDGLRVALAALEDT